MRFQRIRRMSSRPPFFLKTIPKCRWHPKGHRVQNSLKTELRFRIYDRLKLLNFVHALVNLTLLLFGSDAHPSARMEWYERSYEGLVVCRMVLCPISAVDCRNMQHISAEDCRNVLLQGCWILGVQFRQKTAEICSRFRQKTAEIVPLLRQVFMCNFNHFNAPCLIYFTYPLLSTTKHSLLAPPNREFSLVLLLILDQSSTNHTRVLITLLISFSCLWAKGMLCLL